MSLLQFFVSTPPLPPGLQSFDRFPVWVLDKNHFFATTYRHLIEKLKSPQDRSLSNNDDYTLLSMPDIYWLKSYIEPEHLTELHSFVYSFFYGILKKTLLKYAGPILSTIPIEGLREENAGGYLYVEYVHNLEICPVIFGLYGEQYTGLHTKGAWVFRATNITEQLCDHTNLQFVNPIGRIGPVSYARPSTSNPMSVACDLRKYEEHASRLSVFPEHPHEKKF